MPEILESLGDPTCPAFAQPNVLSRMASLFSAPAGLDRMGAVKTSTRQRAFEICEWSASQGRPLFVLWGKVSNPKNTEHYGGYGVDFMTFSNAALTKHDRAIGDGLVEYMLANRVRLNIKGIIWRQRRIGYSSGWNSWVPMADRGSATANHYDHVHGLFGAGDYVPPTGTPAPPVVDLPIGTVWVDLIVPGVKDSTTWRLIQRALGVPETGEPDAATIEASKAYQQSLGDDVDGWLGVKQVTRLFADKGMNVTIRTDPSGEAPAPVVVPPVTKPPVVVPPTSTPKPDPKPEVPVSARLSVVTANVFRRTEKARAGGNWTRRKAGVVSAIKSGSPDLVLGMELDRTTAADVAAGLGNGWAYDRCSGIGIFWRQEVLERTGDGVPVLYPDKDNRYLFYIPFRHKASGIEFKAAVTHLENNGGGPGDWGHIKRNVEMTEFVKRTVGGKWVFGADLNSTTRSNGGTDARGRQKPRPKLKAAGWWLLTDQSGVTNRQKESHHGGEKGYSDNGPWIDDCGAKGGVEYVSGKLILTDATDASDHNFLQMTVNL